MPDNDTQKNQNVPDNGKKAGTENSSLWKAVPLAAKIAGVFILVAGTFFATRASLQKEIAGIKAYIGDSSRIWDYLDRSMIYQSITNLKIIERDIERVGLYFATYESPVFNYAKGNSEAYRSAAISRRLPPYEHKLDPNINYVVGVKDGKDVPLTFRIEALGMLVLDSATRAISDKNLVADLYALLVALSDWNSCIFRFSREPDKMNPVLGTHITFGLTKSQVDDFFKESTPIVERIKAAIPGLKDRVADAYSKTEKIIE